MQKRDWKDKPDKCDRETTAVAASGKPIEGSSGQKIGSKRERMNTSKISVSGTPGHGQNMLYMQAATNICQGCSQYCI